MKRRILSIFCALALCLGLMPTTVFAANSGKAIQLGTDALNESINSTNAATVYFGKNNEDTPGAWRVIGYNSNGVASAQGDMALLAAGNMGLVQFDADETSNEYAASDLKAAIDALAGKLTEKETAAVNKRTLTSGSYTGENTDCVSGAQVDNAVFWPLSTAEASAVNSDLRIVDQAHPNWASSYWWLRSPCKTVDFAAVVNGSGTVLDAGNPVEREFGVRPAFHLALNSVLFTSAAVGGKSASGMDSGLTAVGNYDGSEWKLTLLDSSRNFAISNTKIGESMVSFSYSGAQTGTNEYISVVIEDNGAITYYGRILQLDDTTNGSSGTASFTLPAGVTFSDTTKLYLFNEQYNGGEKDDTKLTDYGSQMIEVDTTAPTLSNGTATRDSETTATVKFTSSEAGTYYYAVVESSAAEPTIDTTGAGISCDSGENTISLTSLEGENAKDLYIVVKDTAGNVSKPLQVKIKKALIDISGARHWVDGPIIYNGTEQWVKVNVEVNGKILSSAQYVLTFENAKNVGTASYTVKGVENEGYTGELHGTFEIKPAPLTIASATVSGKAYDGTATVTITGVTLDGVYNYNNDDVSVADTSTLTGTLSSADAGTYYELTLTGTASLTGTGADNYTLTLPSEGMTVTNVNDGSGVTISKATSSISFNNYTPGKTYDGTALANPTESELTLTGAGYNDVTFTWYEGTSPDGAKLDSAPTDAGTYYLVAFIPDSNNTSASEATSEAITISPKLVSNPTITLSGTSFEYTGSEIKPTVTVKDGETVIPASEYTVEYSNNTNVGTATVTIKDVEGGNYTVGGSTTFEITKAKAVVTTAPTANTLTYTGNPQALVTAGEAEGGTMQYSTDGSSYSADIPTGTGAGTYTVWYKVVGDDNHSDTQPVKLEVTIAGVSIDGAVVTLTPESSTYTGSEQRPTVTVTLDSQDLDGDTDYEVSYDPAKVKNAGTYTVTVTGTGNYEGTATATFTIQKADPNIGDVTYSGGDLYDSTALDSITLSRGNQTVSGTLELDAGQILRADVSSYKWTFTPDDAANYETITGTVELTVQTDTLTGLSVQTNPDKTEYVYGETFDTTGLVLEATYASNNTKEISAEEITVETTGPLTCDMTAVTVSYQGMECQVPVTVNKATYSGQTTVTGTIWANTASEVQLPQPPDGATFGDPVYSVGSDTVVRVEITGNTLAYEGGSGITKGQEYEITVPVNGGTNYENYDITVTLIGTDKKVPTGAPTLSTTTITYGQSLSTITLSGSMQDGAETVTGTFAWADPDETPNAGSYEARWTFTPDNGDLYEPGAGTVTITVNKATPRGTPKYTAITTSGKTLADAGLTTEGGTFSVPGTVAWELDDTTQVQANTAYTWKFTPDDSDNYNSISGSVTLYTVSSGGGGGGGSSSSNITTETTKNPDGSTTTTVTNKNTGTVTETTTWPDGSKEIIETKKDGTVTTTTTDTAGNQTAVVEKPDGSSQTTVSNKDGSGSVTLVDADGNIISQATLSESAVAAAQAAGEAVALPMPEVPVTTDRETAPTVTVNLPVGGSVKVEIPVEDVTTGTVAVLVKSNGDEEIIKTSVTTGNGVAVTLNDGDTVKIVDNSRDFADVPDNYWGAEAVGFAVSRELFAGTSATTFAPDTAMTRGMIVTVLARFEGVDTSTGDTWWYAAGQQWAVANGVSDGTNLDSSLTREQLATMLYRYAQSKGYDTTQGGMAIREYADFEQISDYAVEAMTWAVNTGLISGTSTTTLSPQGLATRAQVATILMRFIEGNQ